jgi:site-specific DNA-cytosine methylase
MRALFNAGGGLGDLAIWMAYHVEQVTVIENDPKAVAEFRARCPHNRNCDIRRCAHLCAGQVYDALVVVLISAEWSDFARRTGSFPARSTFVLLSRETPEGETTIRELTDT